MLWDGVQFLMRGGPTMVPLVTCAILSVAVMLERYVFLKRAARGAESLTQHIRWLLDSGRDEDALKAAAAEPGPISNLLVVAIGNRNLDTKQIERKVEERALLETPKLSERLSILDTIITISPLLGLLGTVTGMIRAFHVVGDPSAANGPAAITGDVAEALIATATGLAIAIVTLVGYNALGERVKRVLAQMELAATQVINIYSDRPKPSESRQYEPA